MLVGSSYQRKSLLVWCRKLHALVSMSKEGSQVASYHGTAPLTIPEKGSRDSAERKRLTGSNSFSVSHKLGESKDRYTRGRSAQSKAFRNEEMQKHNQRRGNDFKVSSELRKLCLEDFPSDRERRVGLKSTQAIKMEPSEIVFGVSPCFLALTQGRRKASRLFVKAGEASLRASVLKVCEEAHQQGVPVSRVSKKDLDRMSSGGVHQGVCLAASPLGYLTEDWTVSGGPSTPLWLVLERIQDPMNLGAILRSAYFLGVDRVISSLRHSCPLSPVVSKASSGAMEVMGVYGCENLEEMLKLKLAQGWHVVGTVGHQAVDSNIRVTQCLEFQITKPTLLLMGGEGHGLSAELLSLCQTFLSITAGKELPPGIESLNVSVAAGILLHSLLFSRGSTRG